MIKYSGENVISYLLTLLKGKLDTKVDKDTQQLYRTANDDKQGQPAEPGRLHHHTEEEQVND